MVALLLILGLFAVLAAPGIVAIFRPNTARIAAPFYLVLMLGLGGYHVGLPTSADASAFTHSNVVGGAGGLCEQALAQSGQAGIIIDRSNPARVVVDRGLWAKLPEKIKEALVTCLQESGPPGRARPPVEIVEAAGR